MKNIVIRYGLYSLLIVVGLPFALYLIIGGEPDTFTIGEIVGYGSIVLSLLFVVLGIKTFKEKENEGKLTFGQGLKVGVLITLIPSIGFGLYNVIYSLWIDPQFIEKYKDYQIQELKASLPVEEFESAAAQMQEQMAMYDSLWVQFFVMFATVFIIGFIITVLSSLFLKSSPK